MRTIPGVHHVTAIASDAQRTVDFYVQTLGLRMVKRTVNFDDPESYHLYFGDGEGHPGTILTFFIWPGARQGEVGAGQVTETAFSIPEGAMDYWERRLEENGVPVETPDTRFGDRVLRFTDPDGMHLSLVAHAREDVAPWADGPVPTEHAIRGFYGVTITEAGAEQTEHLLKDTLGFHPSAQEGSRYRYETGDGGPGTILDVLVAPEGRRGRVAVGTVHHVAWRTPTDQEQVAWRHILAEQGYNVTPVIDRNYFHSIYFREPGGVLFEIATDPPGFTVDESEAHLGEGLALPPWFEASRSAIEAVLPPIEAPAVAPPGGRAG